MKNDYKKIILLSGLLFGFPLITQAQENVMENFIANMPFVVNQPLVELVFNVIRYLLGFLGVVAVVILIYGGFLWMTARGNEEQVKKAKKTIINGLIGLIIIMLSFIIVQFVIGPLIGAGRDGRITQPPTPPGGWPAGRSYLVVTSKYPQPTAIVAKNNKIIVTFNQNLDETSVRLARPDLTEPTQTTCTDFTVSIKNRDIFIDGSLKVRGNALIFVPKAECPSPLDAVRCKIGESKDCSLELTPDGCCGCFPAGEITVTLRGPSIGFEGLKGMRAFGNKLARDVNWSFNVGDYLETDPPKVENNLPKGDNLPRNVGITVVFSKEIDLSTLKIYNPNCVIGSPNCNVANCGTNNCLGYAVNKIDEATVKIASNGAAILGFFERLSTRAFLFRPSAYCPRPAERCRCLPANSEIRVELTDGIKDVNCNSLVDAPFTWTFRTSDTFDLDPPTVSSNWPEKDAQDVDRLLIDPNTGQERGVESVFNETIDPTSVNEDTFVVRPDILAQEISTHNTISIYKPYRVLEPNTRYSPIIFGGGLPGGSCQLEPDSLWGVKDLAGNAMVNNYLWNFTTSWQVGAGEPRITRVSPSQGPPGQCVTIYGFNLGCCLKNPCPAGDKPAQINKLINRREGSLCQKAQTSGGRVEFCSEVNEKKECTKYISAEVLSWKEINQPLSCTPPGCPAICNYGTCTGESPECFFSPIPCEDTPHCCPLPANYSPENEIIVRVPEGAINRAADKPGQIKVIPAH